MITVYYHESFMVGVIVSSGMPAVVFTDEKAMDYQEYVKIMHKSTRQIGKSAMCELALEALLRCPDESVGWRKL